MVICLWRKARGLKPFNQKLLEILPVERLEATEDIKLDSERPINPNFLLPRKQATKPYKKHSSDIRMKSATHRPMKLLLGKARY